MDTEDRIWIEAAKDSFASVKVTPTAASIDRVAHLLSELAGMGYGEREDVARENCKGDELAAVLDWIADSDDSHWDEEE